MSFLKSTHPTLLEVLRLYVETSYKIHFVAICESIFIFSNVSTYYYIKLEIDRSIDNFLNYIDI